MINNRWLLPRLILWALLFALHSSIVQAAPDRAKSSKELFSFKGEGFFLYLGDREFEDDSQQPGLELRIEGLPSASFEYLALEKPSRFVVDVIGLQILKPENIEVQQNALVKRVRLGVYEKKARIVLDLKLKKAPRFLVTDEENAKIFRLLPENTPVTMPGLLVAATPMFTETISPIPTLTPIDKPSLELTPIASVPEFSPKPEAPLPILPANEELAVEKAELISDEETKATPKEVEATATPEKVEPTVTPEEVEATATPEKVEPTVTPEEVEATAMPEEAEPNATPEAVRTSEKAESTPSPVETPRMIKLAEIEVQGEKQKANVELPLQKVLEAAKIEFQLDKVLVMFKDGDSPLQNVTVRNPSSKRLFMSAATQQIKNPGTPQEQRVETQDLLVSPKRFAVEPGSERAIRLMLREFPADIERAFSVTFAANKEGFEAEYITVTINGKETRLRVETNLGITVLAEPPSPRVLIGAQRTDDAVVISNRGNVSVRLTSGKVCREGNAKQCVSLNQKRLYPNDSWSLKVPDDWSLSFVKDSVLGFEPFFVAPVEH